MLSDTQVRDILVNLGWLSDKDKTDSLCVTDAVRKFQEFMGLEVDGNVGQITNRTLLQRMMFGCGNQDVQRAGTGLCKWNTVKVAWYIANRPPSLPSDQVDAIYAEAWESWNRVCGLEAYRVDSASKAHVVMDTGRGRRVGFDGPGGVLAWSQLPCGTSQVLQRYDTDEPFGADAGRGRIALLNVAAHEIGHALGLDHIASSRGVALMNPIYAANVPAPKTLDIAEVIARYGDAKPTEPEPPPTGGGQVRIVIDGLPNGVTAKVEAY